MKQGSTDNHDELQIQSLVFVLLLGGVVGLLDPVLEQGITVRSMVAFASGVGLLLLIPVLYGTKSIELTMFFAVLIAWACFFSLFVLSGDHFFLAQGHSVPFAAAMFLRSRLAIGVLVGYGILAIMASFVIQLEWWVPPYLPSEMRRGFVGDSVSIAMIASALALPAAWKELRSRRLIKKERAARAEANEERRRFEKVVNSSYGAIIEADHRGRILLAQGPLIRSMGFQEKELTGRHQLKLLAPKHRPHWIQDITKHPNGLSGEARVLDAAKRERWVSLSTTWFLDSNSQRRYVTAIRDIEQEVASRNQMLEMTRLESLSTICAGLAHDFNNVLTVFGVLCEQIEDEQLQAELLSAQTQASELTAGLLSFSKQRDSVGIPIRVGDFANEIEPIVARIAGAKVTTTWTVECPDAVVVMEHLELQQVFFNLVMNARHAMTHGGEINVRISPQISHRGMPSGTFDNESLVRIEVMDSGEGMDEAILSRAVEPFFTTKPRGVGTGLGLSTTHGTVVNAGGSMNIDSQPGVGTTVTILLPNASHRVAANSSTHKGESVKAQVLGTKAVKASRIAVIEDREILARSICTLLESAGYTPTPFTSAEEFLSTDYQRLFDVVLSDIELPGMNGTELVDRLCESWSDCRVVLTSGHRRYDEAIEKYSSMSIAFIQKPFRLGQLVTAIENVIALGQQPSELAS